MASSYILTRLTAIEQELSELRKHIAREERPFRKVKSLHGILGEVEFSEQEIDETAKSLFRDAADD